MKKRNLKQVVAVSVEPQQIRNKHYDETMTWLTAFPTPLDLFEFFTTKLRLLNKENDRILQLVESYQIQDAKLIALEEKLNTRDQDAFLLQKSLQDAQVCILDERENYLKLVAENEQLKLQNDDLRRKFHASLLISGTSEKDVTHFLQRHPRASQITDEMIKLREEILICSGEKTSKYDLLDPATLTKQIQILEKQQKDTKLLHQEKLASLKKNLNLLNDEHAIMVQHLEDRIAASIEQLRDKTALLHKSLVESLELQKKALVNEEEWMRERKHMINLIHSSTDASTEKHHHHVNGLLLDTRKDDGNKIQVDILKRLQKNFSRLEVQLTDKENLVAEYKMQTLRLEKHIQRLREENDEYKKTYDDQIRKLLERNQILKKRLDEGESRRKLDGAGFRTDVKNLRGLLTGIDKHLNVIVRKGIKDS